VSDPRDKRITELERENTRWRKRVERAEALVEVQKNIAALLGTPLDPFEPRAADARRRASRSHRGTHRGAGSRAR